MLLPGLPKNQPPVLPGVVISGNRVTGQINVIYLVWLLPYGNFSCLNINEGILPIMVIV